MLALITATFNSSETLRQTLDCLRSSQAPARSIFIDGGSDDSTGELIEEYRRSAADSQFVHQRSKGLYAALNEGIECALSCDDVSHIGLLHSDDILLLPDWDVFVRAAVSSSIEVAYSDVVFHNAAQAMMRSWSAGEFSERRLLTGWMPPHTGMLVSRRVYEEVGLYRTDLGTAADYDWIVRVFRAFGDSLSYYPRATVSMLSGGSSSASLAARLRANRMDGRAWSDHSAYRRFVIRLLKPARKVLQFRVPRRVAR